MHLCVLWNFMSHRCVWTRSHDQLYLAPQLKDRSSMSAKLVRSLETLVSERVVMHCCRRVGVWLLPSCALGLITTPRLPIGIPPTIVTREDRSSILKSIDVLACSPIRTVARLRHVES